jgi:Holliday junction resolvase RusA-like endonuclease
VTPADKPAGRVVKLVLDYPPTGNNYKRHFCTVGPRHRISAFLTQAAARYKVQVSTLGRAAGMDPLSGPVRLHVGVFRPRAQGDIDNVLKVAFDALQGVAFGNDGQVRELHVYLDDTDKRNPRLEIRVEQIIEAEPRRRG